MLRFLLPCLLFALPVSAESTLTWAHTESGLPVDPKAHFGELDNGLRYVIYKNAEPPGRVSLRLHVDAGSLNEQDDQQGMAHFLEHMLFNGSENYTAAELIPQMQRLGIAFGAHANAYTSFDETVYMLDLPNLEDQTIELGFTVMRDFCDGALMLEKEVEAERGVILSEKNSRDSVDFRLMKQQFNYMIPDHLAAQRFPIGTEECIKNTPHARIKQFYTDFYDPRLMTFMVIGDIDVAKYEARIKEVFGSMEVPETLAQAPAIGTITEPTELKTALFTDKEVDEEDVSLIRCLQHRSVPDTAETRAQQLPIQIANNIITRRLEKIAKQEGSPINAGMAYKNTWFDEITFGSLYVTPTEGMWKESVAVLEQEFRRAFEHGFTQAEFKEATDKIRKGIEVSVEAYETRQSSGIAGALIPSINDRKVFTTPMTDLELLEKILVDLSPGDCHGAFVKFWDTPGKQLILTTTADSGNDADLLKSLYLKSQETAVEAPTEAEMATFGYTDFGNTSKISNETHHEDLDLYQIDLDNGVRLNLKKTDYEKGKIYVQARYGDGKVSTPISGLNSLAQTMLSQGGLGKHSIDELQQIFSGNLVSANFAVEEDAFTLSGLTNASDLELQCRLLCAYLTDPGYREEAYRLYQKSLPDSYEQLAQNLEGAFQYLTSFSYGGATPYVIPTEEEAAALTIDQVRDWIGGQRDSYLEITIAGDLDLETTKQSVLATFGTLPAVPTLEAQSGRTLELPETGSRKSFTYTSEIDRAAALTAWRTTGLVVESPEQAPAKIAEARRLNILASIVTNRMREEIREKLGTSYSPYARSRTSDSIANYGHLSAISICKTEDIDEINEILLKIGDQLATEGASADELDRAKNPVIETLDASLRQNPYWLSTVMTRSSHQPYRLDWARNRSEDYNAVTLDDINALAKQYLNRENALVYKIHPE